MCWHHVAEGYFGDILETIPASILRVSEWLLPHWDGMLGEYVLQGNLSSEVNQFVLVGYFYPRCLLCVCVGILETLRKVLKISSTVY